MATTVLYRISSNEVVKISSKGQPFAERNTTFWGVLTDPTFTDGTVCRDDDGDLRILGYAKIVDSGEVRNATQVEIDTFEGFETDDENQQDADGADDLFVVHPRFRKLFVAITDIVMKEVNILRGWNTDLKAVIDGASNFGDVKSGVAAMSDLPDRTISQLKTQIRNRIDKDD